MGRFRCTVCDREYYDKRFLWEDPVQEPSAKSSQEGQKAAGSAHSAREPSPESDWEGEEAGSSESQSSTMPDLPGTKNAVDELRTYADAVRATGTMANFVGSGSTAVLGTAAHAVAGLCAPLSVLGGVIGTAGGISQLTQGLTMPSGQVDPHLVAKGGVAVGVGSTCMVLGGCAALMPPLFFVALGLGAAGARLGERTGAGCLELSAGPAMEASAANGPWRGPSLVKRAVFCFGVGTAGILDATMSGLCSECRVKRPADHKAIEGWETGRQAEGEVAPEPKKEGEGRLGKKEPPSSVASFI